MGLCLYLHPSLDEGSYDTGSCFVCMYSLFGILVCLDAHLPRPGGRGEELELPTGQETLTALRTGEGVGEMGGYGEEGSGNFYKQINKLI